MELIIREGFDDSQLKKNKLLRKLKKDSKVPGWEEGMWKSMDKDWCFRVCHANLILGNYSWEGWGFREPRDFLVPDLAPWWYGGRAKSLLILGEQGLGDEILFASLFNEIDVPDITVECDQRLKPVFERNFPNIEFIGRKLYVKGRWGTDNAWAKGRKWGAQTLMGDLPTWYRRSKKQFPKNAAYLKAEPDPRYLGLTGYSWIGRQGKIEVKQSKSDLSLQYGVEDHLGFEVPGIDLNEDIDGLFSVIAGLEKVISVPTTVVHIAGSLGIPVDVIKPPLGVAHGGFGGNVNNALNWRFNETGCDWHPSVRIL